MDFYSDPSYQNYLTWERTYQNAPLLLSYGSFYYKGLTVSGTCPDWETFFSSQLLLPSDEVEFVSVQAKFQLYDYSTKRNLTQSFMCKRKNIVQSLITAMSFGTRYEANCDGNSWKTYR
jgi:hypothetical protein